MQGGARRCFHRRDSQLLSSPTSCWAGSVGDLIFLILVVAQICFVTLAKFLHPLGPRDSLPHPGNPLPAGDQDAPAIQWCIQPTSGAHTHCCKHALMMHTRVCTQTCTHDSSSPKAARGIAPVSEYKMPHLTPSRTLSSKKRRG